MEILPLTPAQEQFIKEKGIKTFKLKDGSFDTMPNRIMAWLKDGPLRFYELAQYEIAYRDAHPGTTKGDMIPYHYSHLLPHYQYILSTLQMAGHIQKVMFNGKKAYSLPS